VAQALYELVHLYIYRSTAKLDRVQFRCQAFVMSLLWPTAPAAVNQCIEYSVYFSEGPAMTLLMNSEKQNSRLFVASTTTVTFVIRFSSVQPNELIQRLKDGKSQRRVCVHILCAF